MPATLKQRTYDPKCEDLARWFIHDQRDNPTDDQIADLAWNIQQAIEEWLGDHEEE